MNKNPEQIVRRYYSTYQLFIHFYAELVILLKENKDSIGSHEEPQRAIIIFLQFWRSCTVSANFVA